jgi:uncharacterized membrane protein YeaQ/YmgE (transglycosylase-associated protein family)
MVELKRKQIEEDPVFVSLEKKADILQATFKHYFDMAMDHHTKAGTTSQILLVIVGAVISFVGLEQTGKGVDMGGWFAIFLIGLFGAVWARKQHERYFYWQHIAYEYQQELAKIVPGFKVGTKYFKCTDKEAKDKGYGIVNIIPDRYLWVILHCIVAFIGLALFLYFAIFEVSEQTVFNYLQNNERHPLKKSQLVPILIDCLTSGQSGPNEVKN